MNFKQVTAQLERNSLQLFYFFMGAAVLLRLVDDVMVGRYAIHAGEIFSYRHPGYFPLYGTTLLLIEWALTFTGGVLLFTQERKWGAWLAAIGMTMSLTQMMQNQKILLWIILWTIALSSSLAGNIPARRFLKWQIILVYVFGALSKVFDQFITGKTLQTVAFVQTQDSTDHLMKVLWQPLLSLPTAQLMSWAVIVLEILIPFLLMRKKDFAWIFVLVLHGGFMLMMKDIASFSFAMFALAAIFYCPDVIIKEEDLIQPVSEPG